MVRRRTLRPDPEALLPLPDTTVLLHILRIVYVSERKRTCKTRTSFKTSRHLSGPLSLTQGQAPDEPLETGFF